MQKNWKISIKYINICRYLYVYPNVEDKLYETIYPPTNTYLYPLKITIA